MADGSNPKGERPEYVPLQPGMSFYQVLIPSKILAPNGAPQLQQLGPFPDLMAASHVAVQHAGALISVTLILHQNQVAIPAPGPVQPKA